MNDGPPAQGGEVPTSMGAKPSIAEVAAWLRRAAEQRDVVEELRPLTRREAAADPPAGEPEPVEAEGVAAPSGVTTHTVEAPAGHDSGERSDDAPQPSHATLTTAAAPEPEPAGVDVDLRDRSEPRTDDGPGDHEDLPVSDPVRRPLGIGRSPGRPAQAAVKPPPAVKPPDDGEPGTPPGEPATAPATGGLGQAAEPADADAEAEDEADEDEDEAVPAVEALVEDDLPLAPPDVDGAGADAEPEPAPAHRGNGHEGGSTERQEPARTAAGGGNVSLFDLDLADLAARARAAGERGERVHRPHLDPPRPPAATGGTTATSGTIGVDEPEPDPPVSEVRDRHETEEVDEAAPATRGLTWDDEDDQGVLTGDEVADEAADGEAATAPSSAASKAKAATVAMATAALQRRRAKSKRYPRGQLKERIGVLRRVRAMLGVVVLTVVLGVAAGAAIGAFIVFVAFALRSAITTG